MTKLSVSPACDFFFTFFVFDFFLLNGESSTSITGTARADIRRPHLDAIIPDPPTAGRTAWDPSRRQHGRKHRLSMLIRPHRWTRTRMRAVHEKFLRTWTGEPGLRFFHFFSFFVHNHF